MSLKQDFRYTAGILTVMLWNRIFLMAGLCCSDCFERLQCAESE